MRLNKLTWAVAAVAMPATLIPATASARRAGRHATPLGGCRIGATVAPRFVEAGEATVVFGQLTCTTTPVAGQTVTVFANPAGSGTPPAALGTTRTDEHGNYAFTTPALQSNSQLYAGADGAQSARGAVKVSPKVTLAGPADGSQLFTGGGPFVRAHLRRHGLSNKVVFAGSVSPEDAGATVVLQREGSTGAEDWHRIGRASRVGQGGTYSISHTFAVPGDANIRVVVRSRRVNAPGASEPLSYEISQAQNPDLTIESSADPISYGQPVTIGGKLTATAPTTVTLLARRRLQHDFTPVTSTRSAADGTYSFAGQTPEQSTFYTVAAAGKASSRLFEGVRYGLTASASANSVAAGTPVTLSGTVTPGHEGHPVYLQTQNGAGVGFHTVEVGKVAADGTYAIAHTFFTVGPRKLRIRVPGDPENQGAASPSVALEVTPAPAAAFTPELPSNSTPPSEGHV
jgi:hypothetical protein